MYQTRVENTQTEDMTGLFILKHKDIDTAMLQMNLHTGMIEYVPEVYMPEELPAGTAADGSGLSRWWNMRAIPDSRKGLRQVLNALSEASGQSLMLSSYGLSLTDHYWVQPVGQELYWKDINFYENDFTDELGNMLTDSQEQEEGGHISKISPSASVNGDMKKKWIIRDGKRYLLKISTGSYSQQTVNEVIAGELHKCFGWRNYVPYEMGSIRIQGKEYPCCLSPLFTSEKMEFVPAYQLAADYKVPNDSSLYESLIAIAVSEGMPEEEIRSYLEYMIVTDFILSNTDRHLNNFGFLYEPDMHRITGMAPLFDTGNSLFYDSDIIPHGEHLLDIRVNSFCSRETALLRYVRTESVPELERTEHFAEHVKSLLEKYTDMPEERAEEIAGTIREKTEFLRKFALGVKIWKKGKYW